MPEVSLAEFALMLMGSVALDYPDVSPVLFSLDLKGLGLGRLDLRWYSLGYVVGIALAWWYASTLLKRPQLFGGTSPMNRLQLDDLMFWIILGVILGGRLGFVLFYVLPNTPEQVFSDPLMIFRVWEGGMAFHGGMLGVALALFYFTRKNKVSLFSVSDIAGVVAPIAIGLVRIANFMNAELYGRHTDSPIGMIFPEGYVEGSTPPAYNFETREWVYSGLEMPRHPSQLYESALEGWLPLVVLSVLVWRFGALKRPGLVAGLFLIMYGIGRTIVENFREPDAFVSWLPDWITMGQLLSIPMWAGGAWLIWNALKKPQAA